MKKPIFYLALLIGFIVGAVCGVGAIKTYEHKLALGGTFVDYVTVYSVVPR